MAHHQIKRIGWTSIYQSVGTDLVSTVTFISCVLLLTPTGFKQPNAEWLYWQRCGGVIILLILGETSILFSENTFILAPLPASGGGIKAVEFEGRCHKVTAHNTRRMMFSLDISSQRYYQITKTALGENQIPSFIVICSAITENVPHMVQVMELHALMWSQSLKRTLKNSIVPTCEATSAVFNQNWLNTLKHIYTHMRKHTQ